jgi:hypothetical protein
MAGKVKKGTEIPTIDVVLVSIKPQGVDTDEIILDTANKIQVTVATETTEKKTLVVKGRLIAQKPEQTTITGHSIVLTDNVFNPELVKILQGGTIKYDSGEPTKVVGYTPPVVGSTDKGQVFDLNAYSAIYDAAGIIQGYERIKYPNCQGVPIALNSEDGVFRASEYTINSAPTNGQAPYEMDIVKTLPTAEA